MERLLTTSVERDGAEPVLLCSNTYDDLGRLATQSLGGTAEGSHAESLAYAYNVRGWTTGITGSNFSQTLHYEDAGENSCYNGNIGAVDWTSKEVLEETSLVLQQYRYTYDGMNRLISASYSAPGASDWDNTFIANNQRDYSSSYTYDLNGNLTTITRKGISGKVNVFDYTAVSFGDIDDLTLEYNGNQLKKVTDQCDDLTYEGAMDFKDGATRATEYTYDANGNMTRDRNKGIQGITYNILNLPREVVFEDGHITRYTYAADGRKLRVEYILSNSRVLEPAEPIIGEGVSLLSNGMIDDVIDIPLDTAHVMPAEQTLMVRDYCGNHIYRNGVLERVLNDVGYADSTGYHYQVKDYRGDVRAVVAQNGMLEETNSYYPYGMLHGTSAIASTQPFKYTSKELDRENGLDWYDFEARMLMSDLGRTTTPDPMAEKCYPTSPYLWCGGNPVKYVDPNGCEIIGVSREDANMAVQNIRAIFPNEEFKQFRELIVRTGKKQNGKSLAKISEEAIASSLMGVTLNEDQKAMVDIVVNTINSKAKHYIEYLDKYGILSSKGVDAFSSSFESLSINIQKTIDKYGGIRASTIESLGGGALTTPTVNGTHSIVLTDEVFHPNGLAVTTGHEIFGHGRSLSLGRNSVDQQHSDAIQLENLILRVLGIPFINSGINHGPRKEIANPSLLPNFR